METTTNINAVTEAEANLRIAVTFYGKTVSGDHSEKEFESALLSLGDAACEYYVALNGSMDPHMNALARAEANLHLPVYFAAYIYGSTVHRNLSQKEFDSATDFLADAAWDYYEALKESPSH